MWALIGGSGFEKFDAFEKIEDIDRSTPFGKASSGIKKVLLEDTELLFCPRHGESHEDLPSEVNYQANIFALKKQGATKILSVSAIGSLREELKPGDLVVPVQYIDRTKSYRNVTFCGDGLVGHMSLANPTCLDLTEQIKTMDLSFDVHHNKTYVCMEGPNFSTKAESHMYRSWGADIIGMTNFPEYGLAREAGLHYLPCCFVTDYDCWNDERPHVTLEEIIEVMHQNNSKAFELAKKIINLDSNLNCDCASGGLKTGLMTPLEFISDEKKQWLEVLRG